MAAILCCFLIYSCIDQINIDLPESRDQQKVIEGYVERDASDYVLWGQVSLTQNASGDFFPQPIGAQISIFFNGEHQISIPEAEMVRIPIVDFHTMYGGSTDAARFQLMAELDGQTYKSTEQVLIEVPTPDALTVSTEVKSELNASGNIVMNNYVQLLANSSLRNVEGQRVSLSWTVTSAYKFIEGVRSNPAYQIKTCYVPNNVFRNDINIANVQDFSGRDRVDGFVIAESLNDFKFSIASYFTVVQRSISQSATEYWQEVKSSNERSGNIYDVFPGRIRTNISNQDDSDEMVNGFFMVSEVDTIRLKVLPEMVGNPLQKCAMWMEPDMITPDDPDPCLNCLMLAGSSTKPPSYWID